MIWRQMRQDVISKERQFLIKYIVFDTVHVHVLVCSYLDTCVI